MKYSVEDVRNYVDMNSIVFKDKSQEEILRLLTPDAKYDLYNRMNIVMMSAMMESLFKKYLGKKT